MADEIDKGKANERLHPILSNEEVKQAKAKARATIEADRKKQAMKAVEEEEANRLKMEEGFVTGGPGDEMVTITVNLAEFSAYIAVNFMRYYHGMTYTVPRHVADSLREVMWRTWQHQAEIEGQSRTQFYQRHRDTVLSPKGITGAPQRPE